MRALLGFILLFNFTSHSWSQDRLTGEIFTTRSEVLAQNGMAATSQPLATQVALDILKKAWTEDYFSHKGEFYEYPAPEFKYKHPCYNLER